MFPLFIQVCLIKMNTAVICLLAIFIDGSYGAVYQMLGDPKHPGHCNSEETGIMEYGEMKTLPYCVRAECVSGGSIEIADCGVMGISTPNGTKRCYPNKHSKKTYPDCCHDCTTDK